VTVIYDPAVKVHTAVLPCRSCQQLVYFSLANSGKRTPFEVDDQGQPTRVNHFTTCPQAKTWSQRSKRRTNGETDGNSRLF